MRIRTDLKVSSLLLSKVSQDSLSADQTENAVKAQ